MLYLKKNNLQNLQFTFTAAGKNTREWFISAYFSAKILKNPYHRLFCLKLQRIFNIIKEIFFPKNSETIFLEKYLNFFEHFSVFGFKVDFFFYLWCRSPSPEPIYSSDGKRLNTREYRKRKELEESRHHAIQNMISLNPEYKPPPDYKLV